MQKENSKDNDRNGSRRREPVTYTDYSIFAGDVRLIGEGDSPIVIDRDAAIEMAKERGMNLVQVAYNKNDRPRAVCRIMDYSKYRYEQKRKEKDAKRRQREAISEIKEIKFSIRIEDGDKQTKVRKIKEILAEGDKVKLSVRLLRREMSKISFAKDTIMSVLCELEGLAELDQNPTLNGNTLSCVIRGQKR